MYKIAVIDDDKSWGLVVQRFFSKEFEVSIFTTISSFLPKANNFGLVIVDLSIPPSAYELDMEGKDLISHLKADINNAPIVVLATAFISKNEAEVGKEFCPEADAFFAKDAGLAELLEQIKMLLATKNERSRIPE